MHIFDYPARLQLAAENGHIITLTDAFKLTDNRCTPFTAPNIEIDMDRVHRAISDSHLRAARLSPFVPAEEPISVAIRRLFPNGAWQSWVTKQGKVWIDARGNVHEIAKMDKDYVLNVIEFLYRNHPSSIRPEASNPLLLALRARLLA